VHGTRSTLAALLLLGFARSPAPPTAASPTRPSGSRRWCACAWAAWPAWRCGSPSRWASTCT